MATFGDLQARIKDELARDTDPDIDAQIQRAIRDAVNYHSNQRYWFLEVETPIDTVSGVPDYPLPEDWRQGNELTITIPGYRQPLLRHSYTWYRQRAYQAAVETGDPSDYAIQGQRIWLYRTPNGVYSLIFSYQRSLVVLDDDFDESPWTNEAEPLIRMRAKIDLLTNIIREAEPTEIALLEAEEQRWLKSLARRTAEQTMTGRVRPSDW